MSSLLVAALGGSIGYLLGASARALGIPSDVRTHDAAVADRDDQLGTWAADRDVVLRRECLALREVLPPEYGDPSSPYHDAARRKDNEIAYAKAAALHAWRDEARRAHLDVESILSSEGWLHRVYRRMARRPRPGLLTLSRAEPLLDAWRKPSSLAGDRLTYPDDATKRTLEDAISTMPG